MSSPNLSIIIPFVDDYLDHKGCLESVLNGKSDDIEVITIGDGVGPEVKIFLEEHPVIRIDVENRTGAAHARNVGAGKAEGQFILFMDSDVYLPPDFLVKLKNRTLTLPQKTILQCLYSKDTPRLNAPSQYKNLYYRFNFTRRIKKKLLPALSSHCFLIRRQDFEGLKGFDGTIPGASVEDAELGLRAVDQGFHILLDVDLEVTHYKRYSLLSLLKTDFNLCRQKVKIWLKHWRKILRHPSLISISGGKVWDMQTVAWSVLMIPFLWAFSWKGPVVSLGFCGLLFVVNIPFYWFIARNKGMGMALAGILISFLDYSVAFCGAIWGALEFVFRRGH